MWCYSATTYPSLWKTIRIARRAHAIIRFNFIGTLTIDSIGLGLTAAGLLNPLFAAFSARGSRSG
jgi:cation-transporting ATPase G/Cu+-exporting ATPase